ncbi:spermidine synthase [Erwinia persicina]|uniref:spermidine synthase n=1 Tax=Erwinia persicina TaxID=55211 RepID=UPI0007892302|nr:fused MFS/spermidine synthase [Erwinia persicina]
MSDIDLYTSSPLFRIRGHIVTTVKDDHGEVIVIDNKTFRIMSFDRIFEQSKMQKNHSALPVHFYIRAMLMAVALTPAKRVLLLGLGGGSLVRALFARDPDIVIDVVELRHAVLAVAQDYFHLPVSEHIHYQVADAGEAIARETGRRYSLIFSDLYSANAIAPLQTSESFLRHCAAKLEDGGWLVLNHAHKPEANSPFSCALTALFTTVLYCTTPTGNVVIYASSSQSSHPLAGWQQQMKETGSDFATDMSPLAQKLTFWPGP